MRHSMQFLLIGLFLRVACVVGSTSTISVACIKSRGPICVIKSLPRTDGDKTKIAFPDLSKRTTLNVLEGKLSNLTEELALTLTVRNLKMEALGLKSIFINARFEELHLRDNKLTTLKTSSSSSPHSFALKLLDVRKNMLKNVSQLSPFDRLEELYLDDNQIDELRMDLFAKMQNLRVLSASGNGILKIVPPTNMLLLGELKSLSLGHNGLTSIEMEKWQLPALQSLQLNNNSLLEIAGLEEFNQFYDLSELKLAGNRWSCGWLRHALGNVSVRTSLHSEGVVLDADTHCSIENVFGICCSFTTMPEQEEEQIFQPEIGQVREAIRRIESRHEEFLRYRTDKLKELNDALDERLNKLKDHFANQANVNLNESERGKIAAKQILTQADQLKERYKQISSDIEVATNIDRERKHLLHFMVYMRNKLLSQAIETDKLWVQANDEKIGLEEPVENTP
ncbi:uncharacterized protein LOC125767813 [Anopheles funestus]|uniref:uncharacterized protein LOC125767813 n=1 Tax=Anopheles funestus TaxID=62324 RepID=UPI0020C674EB|nr:uncharacterized protein LOC125767813 [Anopheles funestus]